MRFLRSLRGRPAGGSEPGVGSRPEPAAAGDPAAKSGSAVRPDDDAARAAELLEEFDAELSDLGRRQVRYAGYAWAPPRQLDRRGSWVLLAAAEGRGADGKGIRLRAGEVLELHEPDVDDPARDVWRFVRVKDGRAVDLEAGPGGAWPGILARPRKTGGG